MTASGSPPNPTRNGAAAAIVGPAGSTQMRESLKSATMLPLASATKQFATGVYSPFEPSGHALAPSPTRSDGVATALGVGGNVGVVAAVVGAAVVVGAALDEVDGSLTSVGS